MSTPRRAAPGPWGAGCMGDSITDEYFNRNGAAHNWVELLAWNQRLDFGRFMPLPSSWGDIRGAGFESNWANGQRTHGDAHDAATNQAPGLARQAKDGKVRVVTLGVNHDYFWFPDYDPHHLAYTAIYEGTLAGADLAKYTDQVIKNLTEAIDTVRGGGPVGVVLFNIVDLGVTPFILEGYPGVAGPWPDAAKRRRVADAVADANHQLQAVADARHVPVIDLFKFLHFVQGGGPVIVGGVTLNLTAYSKQPPADPHNFFADSQHPGTVASGLFANMVVLAVNQAHGGRVEPLSDQEVLQYAAIPAQEIPPPQPPRYFDVHPYVRA